MSRKVCKFPDLKLSEEERGKGRADLYLIGRKRKTVVVSGD